MSQRIRSQKRMLLFSLPNNIYLIEPLRDAMRDHFIEIASLLRAASYIGTHKALCEKYNSGAFQ